MPSNGSGAQSASAALEPPPADHHAGEAEGKARQTQQRNDDYGAKFRPGAQRRDVERIQRLKHPAVGAA